MVREPRHLVALVVAVVTVGQRDAEYLRGNDGVLAIGLVEVAATKQQQRLRVLRLEVEKLFHHWCEFLRHSCRARLLIIIVTGWACCQTSVQSYEEFSNLQNYCPKTWY